MIYLFVVSFLTTAFLTYLLIPKLKGAGIVGVDENKVDRPKIPEMGGLAIIGGFSLALLLALFLNTFNSFQLNAVYILASLSSILIIAAIGVIDDLISIPQWVKALTPACAAIPLMAVKAAGSTAMSLPFIGYVDFGIFYILLLIPLGVTVASNLTNMLAGFNGLDSGLGFIMFITLSIIALFHSNVELGVISLSMAGALGGFLLFNFFPARVFPGDVGSLSIGAALANAVIIGNLESAGAMLVTLHVIDFFIKALNGFPHTYQEIKGGKLYPKEGKIKGLIHLAILGGRSEREAVALLLVAQSLIALLVLFLFLS